MPSIQQMPSGIMDILLTFLELATLLSNMAPSIHNITYSYIPLSSHPHQHLLLVVMLILTIQTGVILKVVLFVFS